MNLFSHPITGSMAKKKWKLIFQTINSKIILNCVLCINCVFFSVFLFQHIFCVQGEGGVISLKRKDKRTVKKIVWNENIKALICNLKNKIVEYMHLSSSILLLKFHRKIKKWKNKTKKKLSYELISWRFLFYGLELNKIASCIFLK